MATLTNFAYGITLLKYIHDGGIIVRKRYLSYMYSRANPGWRPAADRTGLLSLVSRDTIERMLFNVNEERNARADNHAGYTDEVCWPFTLEVANAYLSACTVMCI